MIAIHKTYLPLKVFFFIGSLLLLLPMAEMTIIDKYLDDGDIEKYIFIVFSSFMISFLFLHKINYFNSIKFIRYDHNIFSRFFLLLISSVSFVWFMFFISKNISTFSIVDIVVFAEGYRNGAYTGTGLYTVPILIVVPSFLLLILLKQEKLDYSFYLSLFFVFMATLFVGLRIYLFGIVIFALYRVLDKGNISKLLITFFSLFSFLVLYKYFLNDSVKDKSIFEIAMYVFSRLDYRTVLEFNGFEIGFSELKYLFDYPSITHFKEVFFSFNNDISHGMPFVVLYSGIALVLPVFLYNVFYFFTIPLLSLYVIISAILLKKLITTYSLVKASLLVNIYFIAILMLIENLGGITKIPILIIVSLFMIIGLKISKIKFSLYKKGEQ